MVSCSSFATELECALSVQQDFNMKLILLLTLLGFIMYSLYRFKSLELDDDMDSFGIFKYWSFLVFPKIILYTFPLLTLTLRDSVSFEIVIQGLFLFYFIVTALFIGFLLYLGKEKILKIFGLSENISFR